jgi:hypothetical protein
VKAESQTKETKRKDNDDEGEDEREGRQKERPLITTDTRHPKRLQYTGWRSNLHPFAILSGLLEERLMKRTMALTGMLLLLSGNAVTQRTSVSRQFPVYNNGGKPDLTIDPERVVSQMEIVDRKFEPGECAIAENVVGGAGYRRLLRFDTVIMNMGDGDLMVGNRSDVGNPYSEYFDFHECHGHYHIRDFSIYELLNTDRTVVIAATKQGFCMEDNLKYGPNKSNGYDCENQGITSGWGDWYYKQLVGQWIDITGVPAGDYVLRVTINKTIPGGNPGIFDEGTNQYPNSFEVPVRIPDPRHKVAVVN